MNENLRLKEVRENLGLTQTEMGKLMDLTLSAYAMIERGERRLQPKHLQKLRENSDRANIYYIETGEGGPLKGFHEDEFLQCFKQLPEAQQQTIVKLMEALLEQGTK